MPQQLVFEWPTSEALGPEDFFVSDANADAAKMVNAPEKWPDQKLVLIGPPGSGKSHLGRMFQTLTDALSFQSYDLPTGFVPYGPMLIEDMERLPKAAEETMFHLHNALQAAGHPLLMTARTAPSRWPLGLPDLASRMQATTPIEIGPPDDALLSVLITKLFADRQLVPPANVVNYIVPRMERSYIAAQHIVQAMDRAALERKSSLTIKLASAVMDNMGSDG